MNKVLHIGLVIIMAVTVLQSCNNAEEERLRLEAEEQVRQDSLAAAREAELEAARQDSLEIARQAAIVEQEEETEPESPPLEFDPEGRFTVQVQSWRSLQKATNRAELWRNVGFEDAYVEETGDPESGDVWYRVRMGNISSWEMAERVRGTLRDEYETESWIDMVE